MARFLIPLFLLTLILISLPLAGVALAGKPLAPYLEFPPRTVYVIHSAFSWWVIVAAVLPFARRIARTRGSIEASPARSGPADRLHVRPRHGRRVAEYLVFPAVARAAGVAHGAPDYPRRKT
jgi:hypothetical protein